MAKDKFLEWWKEDAERHNKMGEFFKSKGYTIKVTDSDPPELAEDGSMLNAAKKSIDNLFRLLKKK